MTNPNHPLPMAVDLKPTEAMATEAERGLAWREEFNRGGTAVGVARARDIKNRKNLSAETVRRMKSYFARHEVDKQGEGFSPGEDGYPSAGRIAWALWGGDPGQSWANERVRQLDNEEKNKAMNQQPTQRFYALEKTSDSETTIHLYDEVGAFGAGSKEFLADLDKLKDQHIHLRINSPGGSVIEGTAIYNALRRHTGGLTVHIDALAASMASVIAMAGTPVYMADNALMMIHNPWTVSAGDSDQLRREADLLDKLKNTLVNAYTRKTGMQAEEVADMMNKETWLDAVEAVALGFADAIEDGVAAAATATPEQLRARFDTFAKGMSQQPENQEPSAPEVIEEPAATVVSESAPVETPAEAAAPSAPAESSEQTPEAPAAEEPAAPAETEAPLARVAAADSILAKYNAAIAERDAALAEASAYKTQLDAARAELAADREALDRLERSLGLAAARVVPIIDQAENPASVYDQWKSATGAEKTRIFRANRQALEAYAKSQSI